MQTLSTLNVESRPKTQSLRVVRAAARMPAIYYGPKQTATPVSMPLNEFIKVWRKAGESSVIVLKHDNEEHEALIHDVMLHPVTDVPLHADFYVIEKGKKVAINVPLHYVGVSSAVKDKGGILVKVLRELKIEAAAKDLPHAIEVDIAALTDMSSVITAKDIVLPKGVTLISQADEVVAAVTAAKEEAVEAPTAVDMSAIEVEKKGKEAKEGEEGAEAAGDAKPEKK
jgi:large subunit ribosomal protein L25